MVFSQPLFPSVVPEVTIYDSDFTSGVTNKVVNKKGIIKKVIVSDGLSKIETENLAYDPYCGQPLLTRSTAEYEKDKDGNDSYVYNYNIPAYMGYNNMGPAYENTDLRFEIPLPSFPRVTQHLK